MSLAPSPETPNGLVSADPPPTPSPSTLISPTNGRKLQISNGRRLFLASAGLLRSSPGRNVFLTTVTTDGKAKQPQVGTNYSNDYVAELSKQGLKDKEVLDRLNARDFELPNEVTVHYFLYSIDLYSGKINWTREFHSGHPPGGRHRKNSFCSETPVTDGNRVYVYINNLGLFAYDLDGNKVWNTLLENFPTILDFGTGSSPALVNGLVIIVNDNEKQQFIAV